MGSADSPPPSGPAGALADAYRTMFRNPPTVGAPKPTWRDRLREFSLTLREGITDDLVRVKEATDPGGKPLAGREDLYKRLTREAGMLGRQEAAVADTVDQITRAAGGPDRMTPDLWEDAGVLLTLYRNIDRAQRGFKNPLGDRLPAADDVTALQREIAAFERHLRDKGTLPQVQQVMQVVRETGNRMLDEQQRVGNLSAEQVKAIRSQNNYWAPYGVLEHLAERDGPLPTPRGYDRLTSGIRRLVGTSKEIDNPLQTLLERVADHTARIERKEILNDTLATFRDYLTEIKPKVRPVVTVGETEANRLLAEATGKGTATVYRPQGVQQGVRDGVLHVLEDGTWKAYQVAPEAHWLENILKANNHEALNTVTRLARWAGTPLRMGATILNPDFLAANLSADLFQAYVVRGLMPFGPSWWRGFAAELGLQHVPGNKQLAGVVGKVFGSDPTLARSWLREGGAHSGIMTEVSRDSLKGMIDRQMPVARTAAIRALMQAGGGSVVGGTAGAVTAPEDQRLERALLGFGAGAVGGRLAGRMTGRTFATVQDAAKALPPEAGQSFLDVVIRPLMTAGQIVEGTTRLGVFDKMLRQGASPAEAALASRSATVDFSRGGTWSKNINHAIPFFNAALQGNRVLLNALKNDRTIPLVKEALTGKRSLASVLNDEKAAGLRMATLATAAAGVWWWNHRNEEIAKLNRDVPEYVKDSELYFVVGKHVDEFGRERPEYLRVPQRTVKLLTTPVERLLDYSYQKGDRTIVETLSRLFNPENAVETAGTTLGSLARIGPRMLPVQNMTDAAPTVLNTAQELTSNWDTFRGREIEPLELTDKRPSERVLPTTSGVAQGISRLAGAFGQEWSPVKVDYAIRNTGAGGARYATDALDAAGRVAGLMPEKPARDLPNPEATDSPEARLARTPIVRRFLSVSGGGETKERKEAVEKAHGPETYAQMREAGRAAAKRFAALSQEQAQLDARLAQGLISGPEWREQRKTLNTRRQEIFATLAEAFPAIPADEAGRRGYAQLLATIGGQVPDSRDRAVVLAETYRAIEAPELPNGQPDFHTIEREQATFKSTLSAEDRTALEERLNQHKTPGERVYAEAVDQLKAYNTIPRYRGMSVEEGNAVNDLVVEARAVSRATGRPLQTVIRQIGREDPDKRTLLPKALRVMRNPRQMANPDRTKFWQAHPLLFSFFSEIPFDLALEQESARELASLGNLMGAGA